MSSQTTSNRLAVAVDVALETHGLPSTPAGYPSLALCVVDSIWSLGVRYPSVVKVIDRYRAWLRRRGEDPTRRTSTELARDIDVAGGPEAFADDVVANRALTSTRGGVLKAVAVQCAAAALDELDIATVADFRERAADSRVEAVWREVRGQRSGISWHYLRILAGVEDIKADRMIRRFVARALGLDGLTPADARQLLLDAHRTLREAHPELTLRALDHAIWSIERKRSS